MSNFNYYKDKYDLIRVFCVVFECDGHFSKAAEVLQTARQTISAKMKTIETDMKCTFFVQDGSIMVPTKEAEKLYIEAKKIITDFESIYRAKNVDTKDIQVITNADRVQNTIESAVGNITNAVDVKINDMQNVLESKNKQLEGTIDKIKTILNTSPKAKKKYLFVVLSFFIISACFYLNKTNFLFDRDLYNNASNGLQAIMRDNYQDISDHKPCSFAVMQMNIDMYSLIDKLTKKSKYKDLSAMIFMIKSEPLISMRFSGDEKSDSILNTNKLIPCDTQKAYTESAKLFKKTQELFARDKNFKIYNFYYNSIENCLGCKQFIKNTQQYPDNLFGIKIDKLSQDSRGWIIKYGDYYYLLSVLNMQKDLDFYEQHIVWRKMTETQFMNYNKGKYWSIFVEHNIKLL